jgi:hypothetical protein
MKAIYKHKESGDLFAIETDGKGNEEDKRLNRLFYGR